MQHFGPAIAPAELDRIGVPTTLIWGRHDLATPLSVAEAASRRYGWPLHVIENANDDPPVEQPEAVLSALHAAIVVPQRSSKGAHDEHGNRTSLRHHHRQSDTHTTSASSAACTTASIRSPGRGRDDKSEGTCSSICCVRCTGTIRSAGLSRARDVQ